MTQPSPASSFPMIERRQTLYGQQQLMNRLVDLYDPYLHNIADLTTEEEQELRELYHEFPAAIENPLGGEQLHFIQAYMVWERVGEATNNPEEPAELYLEANYGCPGTKVTVSKFVFTK